MAPFSGINQIHLLIYGYVQELYAKSWTKSMCEKIDLLQELCDDRNDTVGGSFKAI